MIDLVITHITHPWGPPWTLETLGNHWRPMATLGDHAWKSWQYFEWITTNFYKVLKFFSRFFKFLPGSSNSCTVLQCSTFRTRQFDEAYMGYRRHFFHHHSLKFFLCCPSKQGGWQVQRSLPKQATALEEVMPFSSFCPYLLNLSVFHFFQRPFCFLCLCAVCVGRRKNFSLGKHFFSHYHAEHLDSWRLSLQSNQYLEFLNFFKIC